MDTPGLGACQKAHVCPVVRSPQVRIMITGSRSRERGDMALNVLVVDDSAVMRSMIIKTLRLCGLPLCAIYEASHGEEGLRILAEQGIDLMILDVNMPVMNGEEMLRCVRQNQETEELPVLVVSTDSSKTRIAVLRHYGARFIHKPFTPEDIRATVIEMTGVSDEEYMGDGPLTGCGPDF